MNTSKINELIDNTPEDDLKLALKMLLKTHASPTFGAVKLVEHEISAINVLKLLGYLDLNSDEYDFVDKLRITKAKARALMYQEALRQDVTSEAEKMRS